MAAVRRGPSAESGVSQKVFLGFLSCKQLAAVTNEELSKGVFPLGGSRGHPCGIINGIRRVEKEPGTRGVAGTGPWQLRGTECAPPSRYGWHQPSPDGRNYVSGLRLRRYVEEKGDPAGPTAARELGISPAQGAGACFRDPDVSARSPA